MKNSIDKTAQFVKEQRALNHECKFCTRPNEAVIELGGMDLWVCKECHANILKNEEKMLKIMREAHSLTYYECK